MYAITSVIYRNKNRKNIIYISLIDSPQSNTFSEGNLNGRSMGAIVPIDFEKDRIALIHFHWKQGLKGSLHPLIKIPNN